MRRVRMDRKKLLDTVQENLTKHWRFYRKAQLGYRKAVIKELESMLADAKEGRPIRRKVELPEPINRTSDYNRVIKMLEHSVESAVDLTAQEFDAYVLDNWSWRDQVWRINSSYVPNFLEQP